MRNSPLATPAPVAAIHRGSYSAFDDDAQAHWEAALPPRANLVFRVFGAVFAIGSVLIAASNFAAPRGQATGDLREIAVIGVVFFTVGCGIYLAATRTLKWYSRQLG
jgi:hypothetical protein